MNPLSSAAFVNVVSFYGESVVSDYSHNSFSVGLIGFIPWQFTQRHAY